MNATRRKSYKARYFESHGPAPSIEELTDTEIPFGGPADRGTDRRLAKLEAHEERLIDQLVEKYGALRVLRAIRKACDERIPSEFDVGATFSDLDEGSDWEKLGEEIETFLLRLST